MRDIFVVLADKEAQLKRLQGEIDLLRNAARWLAESEGVANATAGEGDNGLAIVADNPQRQSRTAAGGIKQFP